MANEFPTTRKKSLSSSPITLPNAEAHPLHNQNRIKRSVDFCYEKKKKMSKRGWGQSSFNDMSGTSYLSTTLSGFAPPSLLAARKRRSLSAASSSERCNSRPFSAAWTTQYSARSFLSIYIPFEINWRGNMEQRFPDILDISSRFCWLDLSSEFWIAL